MVQDDFFSVARAEHSYREEEPHGSEKTTDPRPPEEKINFAWGGSEKRNRRWIGNIWSRLCMKLEDLERDWATEDRWRRTRCATACLAWRWFPVSLDAISPDQCWVWNRSHFLWFFSHFRLRWAANSGGAWYPRGLRVWWRVEERMAACNGTQRLVSELQWLRVMVFCAVVTPYEWFFVF